MSEPNRIGCLNWLGVAASFVLLTLIGSCAALNSIGIAKGFPSGLKYDRVLAYEDQPGFVEGCTFSAYQLSATSSDTIQRLGPRFMRDVQLGRPDGSNPYSAYRPTPLALIGKGRLVRDGHVNQLFALGASGGCDGDFDQLPNAARLLAEAGNWYAISANGEGLSIVSPGHRLVLFLYYG